MVRLLLPETFILDTEVSEIRISRFRGFHLETLILDSHYRNFNLGISHFRNFYFINLSF